MTETLITQMMPILVTAAGTLLTALVALGLKQLNSWIKAKVQSEQTATALIQLSEAVGSVVMDLEVEVRRFMSDGQLTQAEQQQLKSMARSRIQKQAPKALDALVKAGMDDINFFLNGKIEAAVAGMPDKAGTRDERRETRDKPDVPEPAGPISDEAGR